MLDGIGASPQEDGQSGILQLVRQRDHVLLAGHILAP